MSKKVNGAFAGFSLKRGFHRVQITYIAPGFRWGFCISSAATVIFLLTALWGFSQKLYRFADEKPISKKGLEKIPGKDFKKQVRKTGRSFGKRFNRNFKKSCKKSFGNREERKK